MSLTDTFLGRRLASSEEGDQKIGVLAGIPSLGLDGLSSAAYGPEAALTILLPLGALGLHFIGPLTLVIIGLLTILYFSYRQTIAAYPNGGGSYTVAKENLGIRFGLLAAAALMLDYTLNVAVGISAGVGALVSAVPSLQKHTLLLCLGMLAIITLANLRGAREAGAIFAVPTYLFVGTLLIVTGIGIVRAFSGHLTPIVAPPPLPAATEGAGLWLLLRGFASGCTAMTGVEAVSNGVSIFRKPTVPTAQKTLTAIVVILAILLLGISYLCQPYHIGAMDEAKPGYQSVISQLVAAVAGRGVFYYVTIGSVIVALALSANTSYAGFPRLCRLIALDNYLPHAFGLLGRRLVYSVGIAFLTGLAGLLLVVFKGITDALIPLFAVGAFLAFTLSQAGMVMHWRRNAEGGRSGTALAINAVGAVATGLALAIILIAKFAEGAWITVIIVPVLYGVFLAIHHHYARVAAQVACPRPLDLSDNTPPFVIVPVESWNLISERALRFGMRLSPDVVAVHVTDIDGGAQADAESLQQTWKTEVDAPAQAAGLQSPRLEIVPSPYRSLSRPLLEYAARVRAEQGQRLIAVIIPELVETRWWEVILHNHRATGLKATLLLSGDRRIVAINVPWYLDAPKK